MIFKKPLKVKKYEYWVKYPNKVGISVWVLEMYHINLWK